MSVESFDPQDLGKDPGKDLGKDPGKNPEKVTVADPLTGSTPLPAQTATAGDIQITDAAQTHIREQIARSGRSHIRLGVKESGCNGFMYTLDFIDEPETDDVNIPVANDVALVVNNTDLRYVNGTKIDLVEEGLNRSLRFLNPNAESHCGCGESFSMTGTDAPT